MLRIGVLGSGSSGNSALVMTDEARILIDAGLSARQLSRRLETFNVEVGSLDAILITHEHGDHTRGLDVFCRSARAPVYCNPLTKEILVRSAVKEEKHWRLVETGSSFEIKDLQIQTFSVTHDATDPVGFTLHHESGALGILSDVGYVTNLMRAHLRGMNTLFIESNYDELLLQEDTKRPWSTKQRILSRHGHLSNDQAATFIGDVAGENLERVILGHLSQDCNKPDLATRAVKERLVQLGLFEVDVLCASPGEPTQLYPVRSFQEGPIIAENDRPQEEEEEAIPVKAEKDSALGQFGPEKYVQAELF